MQLKVFMVPVKSVEAIEPEMNAFLRGHRVLAVRPSIPDRGFATRSACEGGGASFAIPRPRTLARPLRIANPRSDKDRARSLLESKKGAD